MEEMKTTASELVGAIKEAEGKKTAGYDTTAEVRRITDGTAWVHIPGGVDETPVALTISAEVGDTVQIRVAGGSAWITGNRSKPPTDDTTAVRARGIAAAAQTTADEARETAEAVESVAVNANTTAATARHIAEGVNEHFWNDNTGAHITEVTQEEWSEPTDPNYHSGGNTLITTQGMAIRNGLTNLAEFSASGATLGVNASNATRSEISTSGMQIIRNISGTDTTIANLGYGPGNDSGGTTSDAPYYSLGRRAGTVGNYSVAENMDTTASGYASHAEGQLTQATGPASHSEGVNISTASGMASHAQNSGTVASKYAQTALGTYNEVDNSATTTHPDGNDTHGQYAVIVGNGIDPIYRSNALTVEWSGNVEAAGSITVNGHNTAIGYKTGRQTGTYSLASGTTWDTVPSGNLSRITLGAGTWIIQAHAAFESNNTGRRAMRIYSVTGSEGLARSFVNQTATNGAATNMQTMAIVSLDSSTTFTIQLAQNSGSAKSVDLVLEAVRIA